MKRLFYRLPLLYLLCVCLSGVTFFWGYCWNWWGQTSLWQLLFQSVCPVASDEARYPQNVDVLVSARFSPIGGSILPGGRTMSYRIMRQNYIYNFETKMSDIVNPIPKIYSLRGYGYITEEWVITEIESSVDRGVFVLFNLTTDEQIPLINVPVRQDTEREYYIDAIIINLLQSHSVFVRNGYAIFSSTFIGDTNGKHYIFSFNSFYSANLVRYLKKNGVHTINLDSHYSLDGRFYYVPGEAVPTIYQNETRSPVTKSTLPIRYIPTGWAYQDQGLVIIPRPKSCLENIFACFVRVPHPILLLRQDPQHLSPNIQAQFEAQDALEARNKQQADRIMIILMAATIGSIGFTIRTHYRRARRETPV